MSALARILLFAGMLVAADTADAAVLPLAHRYCGKDVALDTRGLSYPAEKMACPFSEVDQAGRNAWRVNVTCGDGSTFSAAIDVSPATHKATLTNADGSSQTLSRCKP